VSCGLRDVLGFEAEETPAVLVASAAFRDAADRQSVALGQPEVRRVLLTHPFADRTDEEMHALARQGVGEILAALH